MKRIFGLALVGAFPFAASAQLYTENFDIDHTANWVVNKSGAPTGNLANFFFDYGTYGIPSAPGSGGTTRGLRLQSNIDPVTPLFSGLSVSPVGQSFSGDYVVTANVWMNFLGPAPLGGSGTTQAGGMGIGTAGVTTQWAGGTQDSIHFSTTMDGGSAVDWRAYSSAAATGYPDGSPVFFATGTGNRNNSHAYYTPLVGHTVPASQTALFPLTQTGTTATGTIGFEWATMVITKTGNNVLWTVDGLNIAQVDASTVTLGGTNILLNMFDTNGTVATDPNQLNFIVFDNVNVSAVPEPATMAVLGIGALAVMRRRRR